jgi:hypothetical protein
VTGGRETRERWRERCGRREISKTSTNEILPHTSLSSTLILIYNPHNLDEYQGIDAIDSRCLMDLKCRYSYQSFSLRLVTLKIREPRRRSGEFPSSA